MENYHKEDHVETRNDLIYVNGKLVGHIDEHNSREYWEMVLEEQNDCDTCHGIGQIALFSGNPPTRTMIVCPECKKRKGL